MMNKNMFNQKGASAIMFAMFFVVIISLISLGFATMVRRDQSATLDKTLSAQAQLATESAVNAVKTYFESNGYKFQSEGGPIAVNRTVCPEDAGATGFKFPKFADGTKITCIKWDATPTEAVKELAPYEGWSFINQQPGGYDYVSWKADKIAGVYGGAVGRRASLPTIDSSKLPILKVAEVTQADITNTSSPKVEVFYLVPSVDGSNVTSVNLGDYAGSAVADKNSNGNASIYNVECGDGKCQAKISGYPFPGDGNGASPRMYYFQLIGEKPATLTFSAQDGGGNSIPLQNVEAKIDANVITQGQSKRMIAYMPLQYTSGSNWQPFFAVLADSLCKDIKVDGTNNTGLQGSVCPAP